MVVYGSISDPVAILSAIWSSLETPALNRPFLNVISKTAIKK